MLIEEAISEIVIQYGYDILKSQKKFRALVFDFVTATDITERQKNDFDACCDNGILRFAQEVYSVDDNIQIKYLVNKTKKELMEKKRLCEECVVDGINMFLKGLGKNYLLNKANNDVCVKYETRTIEEVLFGEKTCLEEIKKFLEMKELVTKGNIKAMIYVADCYGKGHIVQKNKMFAKHYYQKAIGEGKKRLEYAKTMYGKNMSENEIVQAETIYEKAKQKYVDFLNEHVDRYNR